MFAHIWKVDDEKAFNKCNNLIHMGELENTLNKWGRGLRKDHFLCLVWAVI